MDPLTAASLAGIAVAAYLFGTFPSGVLVARAGGVDIRSVGSGNIGASNVARTLGRKRGILVLALDALKGAIPVVAVELLDLGQRVHPYAITAAGLGAIVGHCFPVWSLFRGGKGVATSLGVLGVLAPDVTGITAGAWLALYLVFRIASLGSIAAALAFPALLWAFGYATPVMALGIGASAIMLAKHRGNIARLLRRKELKV